MRLAEYLVDHYGLDADITQLLDYNESAFAAGLNPDGRVQVENTGFYGARTPMKLLRSTSTSRGEPELNFDFHWDGVTPAPIM